MPSSVEFVLKSVRVNKAFESITIFRGLVINRISIAVNPDQNGGDARGKQKQFVLSRQSCQPGFGPASIDQLA